MGKAVGRLLAEKGANVVIVSRNAEKLQDALKYIRVCLKKFYVVQRTTKTIQRNMLPSPRRSASTTSAPT